MTASWRFPVPASSPQQCLYGTQDPVQLWPSTSEALSKVYRGLNQIRSSVQSSPSSSSTSLSASGLESVLSHYNYLSQLQASYDTVLIPRRDTRTLFLLQSKERKTRDNLNQLLRIAMDLIWLNEKERQRKRRRSFAGSSLLSDKDRPSTIHIHNPADDYHGLRVSEYTILMDWVGSVSRSARVSRASQEPSFASNDRLLAVDLRSSLHQHSSGRREPVDRAWAIWQDFLLTGMKPDVVLYTSLMDMLLKAKEFDRADQIWQHMQQKSNSGKSSYGMSHPISSSSAATVGKLLDPLAKSLNLGAKDDGPSAFSTASANRKPYLVHILDKKNRSHHYLDHSQDWDKDGSGVTPNLQTFSVLIQNHVLNKDLKAIARTYKEMQRQATNTANPSSGQQRRPANTVLLNQILKVLIDLGEASAAKEIYADMKMSSSSSLSGSLASERGPGEYTTETGAISTATSISASSWRSSQSRCPTAFTSMSPPPHHQNFQRRAAWERGNRERRLAAAFELSCPTSLWMRPDDTTHRLMLRLARQEGDVELEDQILEELLPSS
ncbi:hypothetical protein BGX28_009483 [Mortierella sp. GBA30]|nr:hypothetical protein BGX28_009483 [Mortierella sp. GBA30]